MRRDSLLRFSRFVAAGAINTAASYAIYFALLAVLPYLVAYTIAYVLGIALSYALMTKFVFRTRARVATALRFPLVYVGQYLLGTAIIAALVEVWNVRASIAAIVAIVVSIPVTYVLSRVALRD